MVEGDLVQKEPGKALVMTGGIGYRVNIPSSTFENLGDEGQRVRLHTHLYVREDQLELFGFMTEEERDVFTVLLSVSGVGPRLALAVLSALSAARLTEAIENKDIELLSSVSGIGKKTAQRLVVELAGKLPRIVTVEPGERPLRLAEEEAVKALVTLGYYPAVARKAVLRVIEEDGGKLETEELVKRALSSVGETRKR